MTGVNRELDRIQADALALMTLPTHALEKLIALLQDGTDLDVFNVPRLLGVSETKAEPILHLLASGRLDRTNVLILLRAMTALRENMSRSAAEVEMCWTGSAELGGHGKVNGFCNAGHDRACKGRDTDCGLQDN